MIRQAQATAEELAEFVVGLDLADIPESVVAKARTAMLDSVGCLLGAQTMTVARDFLVAVEALYGGGDVGIPGTSMTTTLAGAIFAASHLVTLLDFDDTFEGAGHPGAAVVPPALILANWSEATERELLTAIIAGYEVSTRIASAVLPTPSRARDVHGFSTWQVFGAATVAGRLLNLTKRQLADALALAGASAPVPFGRKSGRRERPYSPIKGNSGWAALGGVQACFLSQNGFQGNRTFFDGDNGFWVMAGSDRCRWPLLTENLGEEFWVGRLSFKPYPCCRYIHEALDSLRTLLARVDALGLHNEDIERVAIEGTDSIIRDFMVYRPQSLIDAQFSLPYAMAMLVGRREPGIEWMKEKNLRNPDTHKFADLVKGTSTADHSEETEILSPNLKSLVTIHTQKGIFEERTPIALGEPGNPMSSEELSDKFHSLVASALGAGPAEEIYDSWIGMGSAAGSAAFDGAYLYDH